MISGALALAVAQAASLPPATPTPRDLYVSCFLVARGDDVFGRADGTREPYSASQCLGAALIAIAQSEGRAPGERADSRFCLPDTADVQSNRSRAMATAYVDWYERIGSRLPQGDSASAFMGAMIERWPCRARSS